MIVKSIDFAGGAELVCDINPIKSEIKVLNRYNNVNALIGIFPAFNTSYRIIKQNTKIKSFSSYVKGLLRLESIIDNEDIVVRDIDLGDGYKFAVIAEKDEINSVRKDYPSISVLDYEITSILRLLEYNSMSCNRLIHFNKTYALELNFENGCLKAFSVKDLQNIDDKADLFSGYIPENFDVNILNNPTGDPKNNLAFGGALYFLSSINLNFLQKESQKEFLFIYTLIILLSAFLILNLSFWGRKFYLDAKISDLKNLSLDEVKRVKIENAVDPLLQVKGLVANMKDDEKRDLFPILDKIGFALSQLRGVAIHSITLSPDDILIEADALSINDIEDFKKRLPADYNFTISETTKDPKGSIKFKIKGKR